MAFEVFQLRSKNRLSQLSLQARPLLTRALEENNFETLVDTHLQNNFNPNEMARMVACAAACVRHSARRRPRMSQVNIYSLCVVVLCLENRHQKRQS